jgi:hypothetical protein
MAFKIQSPNHYTVEPFLSCINSFDTLDSNHLLHYTVWNLFHFLFFSKIYSFLRLQFRHNTFWEAFIESSPGVDYSLS